MLGLKKRVFENRYGVRAVLFALLLAFCFPAVSRAEEENGMTVFRGDTAKRILSIASNLPWVADGEDTGKHLYVFYAPWCGVCKMLYDKTRDPKRDVQIRWVLVDSNDDYTEMFEHLTMETLEGAFNKKFPEMNDEAKAKRVQLYYLTGVYTLIANQFIADEKGAFGFPTSVFGSDEKVYVASGLIEPVSEMLKMVPQGSKSAAVVPDAVKFAGQESPAMIPLKGVTKYINRNKENAITRIAPFAEAGRIGSFAPNDTVTGMISGVDSNGFVYIDMTGQGKGPYMYVEDKAFAESVMPKK